MRSHSYPEVKESPCYISAGVSVFLANELVLS